MTKEGARRRVVVAGASGFIGRALPNVFGLDTQLIGLTRDVRRAETTAPSYEWRTCDLFSRRQTIDALEGADYAVYLAHSMGSSPNFTQGHARDMDLLCADNFARACRRHGVEQIVSISGIIPREEQLSEHVVSRVEVEETLRSYRTPVVTIRAGLVLGPGGESTEILVKLVERLPAMLLPSWTEGHVQPIARDDLAELIAFAVGRRELDDQTFDVGGPDVVTYRDLLEMTAEALGRNRAFLGVPLRTPSLSSLWVSTITGEPRSLVRPIIDSLRYEIVADDTRLQDLAGQRPTSLKETIRRSVDSEERAESSSSALVLADERHEVRSVQRLPMPAGRTARWVAHEYARWLPKALRPFLRVDRTDGDDVCIYFRLLPWPLLELDFDREVSRPDRQLFWIGGGLLAGRQEGGRLEFRTVLGGRRVLAAIHEFRPRLPWVLYLITQAQFHLLVMQAFARYLGRLQEIEIPEAESRRRALPEQPETSDATTEH